MEFRINLLCAKNLKGSNVALPLVTPYYANIEILTIWRSCSKIYPIFSFDGNCIPKAEWSGQPMMYKIEFFSKSRKG
jgi:hypothetical protein